jgi:hypothetical protein
MDSLRMKKTPVMSMREFALLGYGEIAYIKVLKGDEIHLLFPGMEELLKEMSLEISVFSLHDADGTPIMLSNSLQAAIGEARRGDLLIAALH